MEKTNVRSICATNSDGIPNSTKVCTPSVATKENKRRFNLSAKDRNHRTPIERSHKRSGEIGRSISINPICAESEQETSTSIQSQIIEQLCPVGEVQTGRFGHCTHSSQTRGLSDEARPQGCVFHGSYIRTPQEIPKVPVSEHNTRVPMSPIWSIHRATSFHEVVETSYSDPSIMRLVHHRDLPRRYFGYASESSGDHEDISHAHWSFRRSGIHTQRREIFTLPNSITGLAGSQTEFQREEMKVDHPARLPVSPSTIFLPFSQEDIHPLWRTLQLAVWSISGHFAKHQDFQKKCAKFL